MERVCGNCALADAEHNDMVRCQPDLLPAEWHLKSAPRCVCSYFKPKHVEMRVCVVEASVERYRGMDGEPLAVILTCDDGRKFRGDHKRVLQLRMAGWMKVDQFYTENEICYWREIWRPRNILRGGVAAVVSTKDELE